MWSSIDTNSPQARTDPIQRAVQVGLFVSERHSLQRRVIILEKRSSCDFCAGVFLPARRTSQQKITCAVHVNVLGGVGIPRSQDLVDGEAHDDQNACESLVLDDHALVGNECVWFIVMAPQSNHGFES